MTRSTALIFCMCECILQWQEVLDGTEQVLFSDTLVFPHSVHFCAASALESFLLFAVFLPAFSRLFCWHCFWSSDFSFRVPKKQSISIKNPNNLIRWGSGRSEYSETRVRVRNFLNSVCSVVVSPSQPDKWHQSLFSWPDETAVGLGSYKVTPRLGAIYGGYTHQSLSHGAPGGFWVQGSELSLSTL